MKQVTVTFEDHIHEILKMSAMEEGKYFTTFARDAILAYSRDMGYLTIVDDINKNLRDSNTRI